jgi:hypothetical protein
LNLFIFQNRQKIMKAAKHATEVSSCGPRKDCMPVGLLTSFVASWSAVAGAAILIFATAIIPREAHADVSAHLTFGTLTDSLGAAGDGTTLTATGNPGAVSVVGTNFAATPYTGVSGISVNFNANAQNLTLAGASGSFASAFNGGLLPPPAPIALASLSGITLSNVIDDTGYNALVVSGMAGSGVLTNNGNIADTIAASKAASITLTNSSISSTDGMALTFGGSGGFTTANLTHTGTGSDTLTATDWTGTLNLTNLGGSLTIGGNNTWNGFVSASGGIVTVNGSLASSAAVYINLGGTLSGTGTINGNARMNGGFVDFAPGGNIVGTLAITGGAFPAYWNGVGTVGGQVTASGNGNFNIGSGANLTAISGLSVLGGTISATDSTSTLTGSLNYTSGGNSIFAGVIAGAGNTVTVNNSAGNLTLGGVNTYTGLTSVTAGTLTVNGSIAPASTVNVGTGGTLAGNGTIFGSATLTGNGVISFTAIP